MQKIIRCVKSNIFDVFMMMHPTAVQVLKEITQTLYGLKETELIDIDNWVSAVV